MLHKLIKRTKPKRSTKSLKVGLPPGTLIFVGKGKSRDSKIRVIDYTPDDIYEGEKEILEECLPYLQNDSVTWIDVAGLSDIERLEKAGELFGLHRLILEDILDTEHMPKVEHFEDYIFFTLKVLSFDKYNMQFNYEQISFILGKNYVLSFQEHEEDIFGPLRERLHSSKGNIRTKGADYLAYAILDIIVDNYYLIIDEISTIIEDLEEEIFENPDKSAIQLIKTLKKDLIFIRRAINPLKDAITALEITDTQLIDQATLKYLKDVEDHTLHINESLESYRLMLSDLTDLYLSSLSNKMNNIMQVLTIVSTIFIPLTFLAGIYGMNFENMPELHHPWAYPALLGVMAVVAGFMLRFFRKKGWL